ncbi:dynactin subunit 2-like [Nannochloropsis oceanica]
MERATEEIFETPDSAADDDSSSSSSSSISSARQFSASQGRRVNSDPENLVPTPLNPDAAFEVFHGKCYNTSSLTDLSGSIAPRPVCSSQRRRREQQQDPGGAGKKDADGVGNVPETPVERYLRLKGEARELAEEVEALVAAQDEKSQHVEAASLWKHLASEVSKLKGDLLNLAEGPERVHLLTQRKSDDGWDGEDKCYDTDISSVAAETDLMEALMHKVDELTNRSSSSSRSSSGSSSVNNKSDCKNSSDKVITSQDQPREDGSSGGVVYELYYDGANNSTSTSGRSSSGRRGLRASSMPQIQHLESRLASLEKIILLSDTSTDGNHSSSSSSSGCRSGEGMSGLVVSTRALPLIEALAQVERQATLLDAGAIETLRQRLVLLKSEWDSFKKERLKLANTLDREAGSHFRRVESVWEMMGRLAPVAGDLPLLVSRLKVLQELHGESLTFARRMGELEEGQGVLRELLAGTKKSVEEVKKSLRENVGEMERNVNEVDKRLRRLMLLEGEEGGGKE